MIRKLFGLFRIPHFITHRWGKWITIQKGEITQITNNRHTGWYECQRRECLTCGKVELKNHKVEVII